MAIMTLLVRLANTVAVGGSDPSIVSDRQVEDDRKSFCASLARVLCAFTGIAGLGEISQVYSEDNQRVSTRERREPKADANPFDSSQ